MERGIRPHMQRPAGIGQEQPANDWAIKAGAFLPGTAAVAALSSKPEELVPSPPSVALPQVSTSDYTLVSIEEGAEPRIPPFCFAPHPVSVRELGLDIRYDHESRHYYVPEAVLEKVLERCDATRQECETHGLLSPAHNVTLPREARECFKIPQAAERCAVATAAATHCPQPSRSALSPRKPAGTSSRTR